jgi:hypothetical protein
MPGRTRKKIKRKIICQAGRLGFSLTLSNDWLAVFTLVG